MRNFLKWFAAYAAVTVLFGLAIVLTSPAFAGTDGINVRAGVIVEVDEEGDYAVVKDACGIFWEFYGIEDFTVGDLIIMELWDANTPESIYDDEIIDIIYSGYIAADVK